MIRVNLTPPEELENPLWMVPDILLAILVCLIGYFAVNVYLDSERQKTATLIAEQRAIEAESTKYAEYVSQLKHLNDQLKDVEKQLAELRTVSGEVVEKYAPIIAVEHVQNLKPQGIWFKSLHVSVHRPEINEEPGAEQGKAKGKEKEPKSEEVGESDMVGRGKVEIIGYALDNLMVAEYLASIRATKIQAIEASDMRTQVYFTNVVLSNAIREATPSEYLIVPPDADVKSTPPVVAFGISMTFDTNPVKGAKVIASFKDFYPVSTKFDVAVR